MHFLIPGMLIGLAGVSVPIAIHLLNRYRFKEVEWGAMDLLRKVLIVRSRRIRLEDLLLLIMRCLIVALVALFLARPVLSPEGASWLGRSQDLNVIIAVDGSFSMQHRPGAKSRFDSALERVRDIGRTLKPGNTVTLMLMGDRPRFLMRNQAFDAETFEAKLKDLTPLPERLNLDACIGELGKSDFIDELKKAAVEAYIITDAQTSSWGPPSEIVKKTIEQLATSGRVLVLPTGADGSENLAITAFEMKTGLIRKGVTVQVQVTNFGKQTRDVPLTLLVNDVPVDQQIIDKLPPDKPAAVSMFARIDKSGPARLTAKIESDELAIDNVRHAVATIREKTKVLLVRAPGAEAEERDYVQVALLPSYNEALHVDTASWLDLPNKKLGDYQVVILSNVPDLPPEQVRNLFFYVKDGGGLIVFLGDNTQPALVNARMKIDNVPLLPATLSELVTDPKGVPAQPTEHPLSRVIAGLPSQVTSEARVSRYFKMKLDEGARDAMKIAGRGDPILAEKTLGRGRVVMFATAPDRAWTNMVIEPGFYPILIHEALTLVTKQAYERQYLVGEALDVALPVTRKDGQEITKATFLPQGGAPTTRDTTDKNGVLFATLPSATQPGFYEIVTVPPTTPLAVAVNVDTRESKVETLSLDGLGQVMQGWPVRIVSPAESIETSVHENRVGREIWKEILILLIVLALVESVMAWWITRKKAATQADW